MKFINFCIELVKTVQMKMMKREYARNVWFSCKILGFEFLGTSCIPYYNVYRIVYNPQEMTGPFKTEV